MSSEDNGNYQKTPTEPQPTGGMSRARTESETSFTSDDGNDSLEGKRRRTISQQFLVASGIAAASPPKFVSLEEIMKAANGLRDMALVHQIAVDRDFRLERVEPAENTPHKIVKDTMHRAFWELLREQLAEDPPNYTQALVLLENIKEGLFGVLLPQHSKLKQQISEVLDSQLIKQQAENDTLDFKHYAQYVISVMAKLCAPVRDEKIKQLTETVDVIETFRGILETLDLMALDMANFTIEMARPDIIAHSVELERKKFADYLAVQADGLQHTRKWLLKHGNVTEPIPDNVDGALHIRNVTNIAFSEACIDLLEWDGNNVFPETFMLDESRLSNLELLTNRLIIVATVMLVTGKYIGPSLHSLTSFKNAIKEHTNILMQSVNSEKELESTLPNIAIQVIADVKEASVAHGLPEVSEEIEVLMKSDIVDIAKSDYKIKQLVRQRVKDFFLQIIQSSTAAPLKVPSGLSSLQKELTEIAGQFLRIVSHNRTVFGIYYTDIVKEALHAAD